MISLTSKSSTLIVLVIVIVLFSITALVQFDGRTSSPIGPSTASSSTSTSLTQQSSTSTSSSGTRAFFRIGLGEDYSALFATPSVTMNYTIKISQLDTTASPVNLTLSAVSTVPGLTLIVSPNALTFVGTQELVVLGISVAPTVNSSTLPIKIIASTANGIASSTFDFTLNRDLVVVLPLGGVTPPTLHVSVGQEVTWLNLMGNQEGDPVVANVALADGSAASPTMFLNDAWSHAFDKPGTYPYEVTLTGTRPPPE
jgi:plastocyanin